MVDQVPAKRKQERRERGRKCCIPWMRGENNNEKREQRYTSVRPRHITTSERAQRTTYSQTLRWPSDAAQWSGVHPLASTFQLRIVMKASNQYRQNWPYQERLSSWSKPSRSHSLLPSQLVGAHPVQERWSRFRKREREERQEKEFWEKEIVSRDGSWFDREVFQLGQRVEKEIQWETLPRWMSSYSSIFISRYHVIGVWFHYYSLRVDSILIQERVGEWCWWVDNGMANIAAPFLTGATSADAFFFFSFPMIHNHVITTRQIERRRERRCLWFASTHFLLIVNHWSIGVGGRSRFKAAVMGVAMDRRRVCLRCGEWRGDACPSAVLLPRVRSLSSSGPLPDPLLLLPNYAKTNTKSRIGQIKKKESTN